MDHLTPRAGSKIIAVVAYLPQHNTIQGARNYQEVLTWLNKTLTENFPDTSLLVGGDLQAASSPNHCAHNQTIENFCTSTNLQPLGDPHTPTYTPTNTPLDHWLIHIPLNPQILPTLQIETTPIHTTYSDHRALLTTIPQIGIIPPPTTTTHTTIPISGDHPPFVIAIPKTLIELYQLGNATTRQAQDEATGLLSILNASPTASTQNIDKSAKLAIATLQHFHNLAQSIWPMAQTHEHTQPHKFYTTINKFDNRKIKRIIRLRYSANNHIKVSQP